MTRELEAALTEVLNLPSPRPAFSAALLEELRARWRPRPAEVAESLGGRDARWALLGAVGAVGAAGAACYALLRRTHRRSAA